MRYDAVLFDLDGTLVDTLGLWCTNYLQMLQKVDVVRDEEWFFQNVYACNGHWRDVLQGCDVPEEHWEGWHDERDASYCNLLQKEVTWLPGAQELLQKLQGSIPLGFMTGSHDIYVDAINECLSVSSYFDEVVTTDDTQRAKPDPEGVLLLAEKLRVDPTNCIYIGDQDFDIGAANAAGMTSCLVRTKWTPETLENKPDLEFDGLDALADTLIR